MRGSCTVVAGLSCAAVLLASLGYAQQAPAQKVEDLMALIKLKSGLSVALRDVGWRWKDAEVKGGPEAGEITFSDHQWLMSLIHWGPIQRPEITVDYVKERMLKAWGVDFQFTGKEGRTTVSGHNAVWVEAYGTNQMFYTRFIMWSCPESAREFIADTNYNLMHKTPADDFELETKSAKTVACHGPLASECDPELTARFESSLYGFSFYYPDRWFFFDSPFYAPFPQYEGVRDRRCGSILALCSDENIRITLKWASRGESKSEAVSMFDPAATQRLQGEMTVRSDVDRVQNHGFEIFDIGSRKLKRIWGTCAFKEPESEQEKAFYTGKGFYEVAEFDAGDPVKTVTVILVTKQYRYGTAESSPARGPLDKALLELVRSMR